MYRPMCRQPAATDRDIRFLQALAIIRFKYDTGSINVLAGSRCILAKVT